MKVTPLIRLQLSEYVVMGADAYNTHHTSSVFRQAKNNVQRIQRRKKLITLVFMKHPTFGGTGETIF
jgi:hypothetical protein